MRALTIVDRDLVVAERPRPEVGPYDVLVEVHAAGINAADLLQRVGLYPAPPGIVDDVPGMELSGIVVEAGERILEPLIGQRVAAVVGGGAQAQYCVVPFEHLLFLPDGVDLTAAGGFPEAFSTAYDALVSQANLVTGERVLISGAAGGVGVAAVQIAHALGATVVASTRDATYHQRLRELGADETVLVEDVGDLEPVDVVLELVGAAHLTIALTVLKRFARVVVIGVGSGAHVDLDLLKMMIGRTTVMGSTLRSRSREEKADVARGVGDALMPRWRAGALTVPLHRVIELDDAARAYDGFAQPGKFGKFVLRIGR